MCIRDRVDPAPYAAQPDRARLVLVTAINPTPAGEGKTTVSVGLADGLTVLGKKSMLAPVSYTHLRACFTLS